MDFIMVETCMLGANGWSLCGLDHGWDMDAPWKRMELCVPDHGWDMDSRTVRGKAWSLRGRHRRLGHG